MNAQADLYHVASPVLHAFINAIGPIIESQPDRRETVKLLREPFVALLANRDWLPHEYRVPDTSGGMGGGIGNYLLYRSATRNLTLMSLVVPAGATTPVHDHLAWGLVGLYGGEQNEWVYRRTDEGDGIGHADLIEVEQRHLRTGDLYDLLPPDGDIHRVATVGSVPSISLHLLGSDVGCTWRHRYEPEVHRVYPFRSSYSNEPCEEVGASQ